MLSRPFIVCFVLEAAMSPPTRRTLKTNLAHLASGVFKEGPSLAICPRERAKAPYTDDELAKFLALADAQATLARRHKASALICLCAGAGLYPGELRSALGTDVVSLWGSARSRQGEKATGRPGPFGFPRSPLRSGGVCRR